MLARCSRTTYLRAVPAILAEIPLINICMLSLPMPFQVQLLVADVFALGALVSLRYFRTVHLTVLLAVETKQVVRGEGVVADVAFPEGCWFRH